MRVLDLLHEFRACDEDDRDCWIWDAFQTFWDDDAHELQEAALGALLHDLQRVMDSTAQSSALAADAKYLHDNLSELLQLEISGAFDTVE